MKLFLILSIALSSVLYSQNNLVLNGDFESYNSCPTEYNYNHQTNYGPLDIPYVANWVMPNRSFMCRVGSADYENTCGPVNQCAFGAHSGGGYMNFFMFQVLIPNLKNIFVNN
jgi:hypothetical protein